MKLFDLHCDTIYECCETGKHLRENDLHINYAAAHRYQPYVQFFALFCGARQPYSPETRDCLLDTPADERFDRMLTTARREFAANADWLTFCRSAADIRAAVEAGKATALLSIEGAELLPDRPDALDYVYDAGVRLITLTWNYRSRYGCSSAVDQNEGLTEEGRRLVRTLDEKGMLIDVSHLSDRGFQDVCEATDRPFVATHSDSRVLCRNSRNLTDEQKAEMAKASDQLGALIVSADASVVDAATSEKAAHEGKLSVSFSVDKRYEGKSVWMVHRKADGSLEATKAAVEGGLASMTVDELSPFAVFEQKAAIPGDDGNVPPSGSPGGEEPSGDTQVEPLPGKALASTGDSAAAPAALALAIAAAVAAMIAQTKLRRRHDSLNR